MDDSQRRRQELLERTRRMYQDRYSVPAVHPRYQAAYNSIYEPVEGRTVSSFGVRVFVCLLLFAFYVGMDYQETEYFHVDSQRVVQEITTDIDMDFQN